MRHSQNLMRGVVRVGLLAAILTSSAALSKVLITKTPQGERYDVTIEDVAFREVKLDQRTFVEAKLAGVDGYSGVDYQVGQPELPVVRLTVEGDVRVHAVSEFGLPVMQAPKQALKPSQPSWSKGSRQAPEVVIDDAAYSSKSIFGQQSYSVVEAGSVRGIKRYVVTLRPLLFDASTGQYSLRRHFTVNVSKAKTSDDGSSSPTIVFVVGAKFASHPKLDELEQSKVERGYRVERLLVGTNGLTSDSAIRAALQSRLANASVNLRHAILIGDDKDVPSHRASQYNGLTDHFYRAIDTKDYVTDINGPDIGVGRLSVSTNEQLSVVVDKIIRYSAGESLDDPWLVHPAWVTTHDRYEVAEGSHNAVIAKHFGPRGYERVFPDANEKGGDKLYPISEDATAHDIVSYMKQGRVIINFSGHGSHSGWEDVTTSDVLSFDHDSSLPYVISNSCMTADFSREPVFAETWQRHPHGAITYWGSYTYSYWDEDDILERALYDGMFDKGLRSFDLMHQNALTAVWQYYNGDGRSKYYWETYVTFGDPSLEFRALR
jgi:hypothetical protein